MLHIFERIGQQVQALGVPDTAQFNSASALLNYILGVAGQNAANARAQKPGKSAASNPGSPSSRTNYSTPPTTATTSSRSPTSPTPLPVIVIAELLDVPSSDPAM